MKVYLFAGLLVCCLLAACSGSELACQDVLGCVEIRPNEQIRIGYLLAESGTDLLRRP